MWKSGRWKNFFIKGVKIDDNYRYILIKPNKIKDGVHLYYINDYDNNPVIFIDSPGYGDIRGFIYDKVHDDALRYIFSFLIEHINLVCFVANTHNRFDTLTKYAYNRAINLFSKDIITDNFYVLATHACRDNLTEKPQFVKEIQLFDDCSIYKKNKWYSFDSYLIFENDIDRLTKYSFENLSELYENTIKKIEPKSIKKCAELLEAKDQFKNQQYNLKDLENYQKILTEFDSSTKNEYKKKDIKKELDKIIKNINDIKNKNKELSEKINSIVINKNYFEIEQEYIDYLEDQKFEKIC